MTLLSFALVLTGVLLNAAAQLLLKAGTNAIGHFEYSAANVLPIGLKVAQQPHILGGLACYVIRSVVWTLALSRAGTGHHPGLLPDPLCCLGVGGDGPLGHTVNTFYGVRPSLYVQRPLDLVCTGCADPNRACTRLVAAESDHKLPGG